MAQDFSINIPLSHEICKDCGHEKKWHWEASDRTLMCVFHSKLANEICKCRNFRWI